MSFLNLTGVEKFFGPVRALKGIDLRIEKGRIHPPTEPGIGAVLRADVLDRHDVVHQISQ